MLLWRDFLASEAATPGDISSRDFLHRSDNLVQMEEAKMLLGGDGSITCDLLSHRSVDLEKTDEAPPVADLVVAVKMLLLVGSDGSTTYDLLLHWSADLEKLEGAPPVADLTVEVVMVLGVVMWAVQTSLA